jgi:hypothetical protein
MIITSIPIELEIMDTTDTDISASCFDKDHPTTCLEAKSRTLAK